jgi:hypothetical protein
MVNADALLIFTISLCGSCPDVSGSWGETTHEMFPWFSDELLHATIMSGMPSIKGDILCLMLP